MRKRPLTPFVLAAKLASHVPTAPLCPSVVLRFIKVVAATVAPLKLANPAAGAAVEEKAFKV